MPTVFIRSRTKDLYETFTSNAGCLVKEQSLPMFNDNKCHLFDVAIG